eukprot:GHVH01002297.1.p1 GENE.GHVH01002297.1~~GHVH01002297.1.p1  ORF type:complete len:162 (-),score=27.03 GHVH01002297.1:540-1025(-)
MKRSNSRLIEQPDGQKKWEKHDVQSPDEQKRETSSLEEYESSSKSLESSYESSSSEVITVKETKKHIQIQIPDDVEQATAQKRQSVRFASFDDPHGHMPPGTPERALPQVELLERDLRFLRGDGGRRLQPPKSRPVPRNLPLAGGELQSWMPSDDALNIDG